MPHVGRRRRVTGTALAQLLEGVRVRVARRARRLLGTRRRDGRVCADPRPGARSEATHRLARRQLRWPRRRRHRDPAPRHRHDPRRRSATASTSSASTRAAPARTRPIDCIDDRTTDLLVGRGPDPRRPRRARALLHRREHAGRRQRRVHRRSTATWLAGVGTRNVARDVDRIRAALGEDRTQLPRLLVRHRARRGVRAGVPDARAHDGARRRRRTSRPRPRTSSARNAAGFEHALDEFLDWCADAQELPLPLATATRTRALEVLRNRFETGATLPVGDGRRAGAGTFYLALLVALYDKTNGWPALAVGLQTATSGDGSVLQILADTYLGRDGDGHYNSLQEAIGIIRCADVPATAPVVPRLPRDVRAVRTRLPDPRRRGGEHARRVRPPPPATERRRRARRRACHRREAGPHHRHDERSGDAVRRRASTCSSGSPGHACSPSTPPSTARTDEASRASTTPSTATSSPAGCRAPERAARRSSVTAGPSARARHVLPRHVARLVGLLREAEHTLTEDVAHHVRRAALDGVGLCAQEAAHDRPMIGGVRRRPSPARPGARARRPPTPPRTGPRGRPPASGAAGCTRPA